MDDTSLESFVTEVAGTDYLRVEDDLGNGFVRLRSSEAERRQAIQDIRSTEDIVIELLRNARDANAHHMFLALHREDSDRRIVLIDDGDGIPPSMFESIFEPRVTSKLDTARLDRWGMHGRGMALYSISVNAQEAKVQKSELGFGSAIAVRTNLDVLDEKSDQSTFPVFTALDNGVQAMRGPKNILRVASEFALEHRSDCQLYCGSFTEIAATLYRYGLDHVSPADRVFSRGDGVPLICSLAYAFDPDQLSLLAESLGLDISPRSAWRIMEGEIASLPTLLERLSQESFPRQAPQKKPARLSPSVHRDVRGLKIDPRDLEGLRQVISEGFADIADRYYLNPGSQPDIRVTGDAIHITIPIEKQQ